MLALLTIPLFIGGIIGTILLVRIPLTFLKYIIIAGLIFLLLYLLFGKKPALQAPHDVHIHLRQYPLLFIAMSILGIYGNVSGVGVGTFQKLAFIGLLRLSVADNLMIGSIIIVPAAIVSLVITAAAGLIARPYLVTLWLGTFIGGKYVVTLVRKIPNKYLHALIIAIASVYLVYLLFPDSL